jgi:DNA-binding CsgD family transcriptional regulator
MIFYFDTISGEGCMNYLSYVSLTIAVAFFFDYIRDRWIIFFLILSYLLWFLINVTTDYYLSRFYDQNLSPIEEWYVRIYKIIEISFCTFVGMYFIYRKERFLVKYYIEKEKLNAMIQKTDKINFSGELYELAMSKNSLFITYFKSQFPDFFDNILDATPNLISSELEICALLKLNLSTKEIAIATNSTVKAIENKKYRIRRKMDLSTETDINLYIINNF